MLFTMPAGAQTATIGDAWWTFQQDCDGDGCRAGTLPGDVARLNWDPEVFYCNGTLTVYEKIYFKPCASNTWTLLATTAPHVITGCSSVNQRYLELPLDSNCACRDYMIQIFRNGQPNPDYTRASTNDVDLYHHAEESLAQDFCLSDTFATCVNLGGKSGVQSDNNANATKEPAEPDHAGNAGGKSLWYCWTATTNTPVTFDTLGSTFDTVLAVYTGAEVSSLTVVTNNDDIAGATNRMSRVTFTPVAGTTYRIAVDGFGGGSGIAVLNWNQTGSALPDLIIWGPAASPTVVTRTFRSTDCEVREGCAVEGTRRLLSFTTETRNLGPGDLVLGSPATNPLFRWASCHAHFHFEQFAEYHLLDTNGNVVATGKKVGFCVEDVKSWSPTAKPQSLYNCNNQGLQAGWADVYASGLPCQYIDITGVAAGDYMLQMIINPDALLPDANLDNNITLVPVRIPPASCAVDPANDEFLNALGITNLPFSHFEFNYCADKQSGEPSHAGNSGGPSVWFHWTPVSNETITVTTKRSDFDTLLAVYTGNAVNALTLVANNDDASNVNKQSSVTFAANAGTTYRIAVDGYNGAAGGMVLNLRPPANDDFAAPFPLGGLAGQTNGYNVGASKESYEAAHASDVGGHSLWYRWTAPMSGPVDFNTAGSTFDTTLAVYTGTVVTNLTAVANNDDDVETGGLLTSRLWFYATAGSNYWIAVDGFGGDTGDVNLNWNMDCRLTLEKLPDGSVKITLTGVDWHRYTLLGSTDFSSWATNHPTITMLGGKNQFTNSALFDRRFFRAIRVP